MSGPVCLITGVGPAKGTGGELSRRFASGGYKVAMLARNGENPVSYTHLTLPTICSV